MKFEEYLNQYGQLTYGFQGVSMLPMLRQDKDVITIVKKQGRCKKYDVALYRRGNKYTIHRVVDVLPDGYVILGDNCMYKELDITDENILGVMVSFVRGKKEIAMDHWGQKLYARIWYWLYPIRFCLKWLRRELSKWLRSKI